jgi:heat shock protein beta
MHYALLQRDDKGFAHPERIQKLVKNYSQFVSFPIYTWQEKGFTKEVSNLFWYLWLFE